MNFEVVDWSKLLVFDEKSKFSTYWNGIDIFTCIISSYFYAYLGCFGQDALNQEVEILVMCFESIFVITLLKHFITDYTPDGEQTPVTNIKKISIRYLHNGFILDFILVIPFFFLFKNIGEQAKLFLFIKTYRVVRGL